MSVINSSAKIVRDTINVGRNPVDLIFNGVEAFVATVLRFDGDATAVAIASPLSHASVIPQADR